MTFEWYSEEYCCKDVADSYAEYGYWMGGSHYHCAKCGKVGGMMTCYMDGKFACQMTEDEKREFRESLRKRFK